MDSPLANHVRPIPGMLRKAGQQGDGWLGNVEARDGQLAVRGMSVHQPLMRQTPDCDDDAIKLKRPDDRHEEGSL